MKNRFLGGTVWPRLGKKAAICFSIDDVHPSTSRDDYEAGGDLGQGSLGNLEWLCQGIRDSSPPCSSPPTGAVARLFRPAVCSLRSHGSATASTWPRSGAGGTCNSTGIGSLPTTCVDFRGRILRFTACLTSPVVRRCPLSSARSVGPRARGAFGKVNESSPQRAFPPSQAYAPPGGPLPRRSSRPCPRQGFISWHRLETFARRFRRTRWGA